MAAHKRVLHIVAGARSDGPAAVEAAEALMASMAGQDPLLRIDELDAGQRTLGPIHDGGSAGRRWGRAPAVGPGPLPDTLILHHLAAADCYVLSVPRAGAAGDGLQQILRVARGPEPRLARADRSRWSRRHRRRMVVVASPDDPDPAVLDDLVTTVRDAFRRLNLADLGVIGAAPVPERVGTSPAGPGPRVRSGALTAPGAGAAAS